MQIYNSLIKKKIEFKPIRPNHVSLYACGMTVYDYCHIGHARSMIIFDIVVRYLRLRGYTVHYVRNITDIDDKIIQRANENHEAWNVLTARFIDAMNEDERALNILPPDDTPCATDYIPQIIELIQRIIEKNYAYIAANGDVYFDVRRFADYGKLSHRDIEQLEAGASARVELEKNKRDPLDFALWKTAKPSEPKWDSPWGEGRPGWHIECSAMSVNLLGQPFDIHGGGMDLKFPHHENEIAQSEAASGNGFANLWMHVGLLQVDGEKMSKSLGNFFTIREVLKKYDVELIRYFMISGHYRSPINYTDASLKSLRSGLDRLYLAMRGLPVTEVNSKAKLKAKAKAKTVGAQEFEEKFYAAMDDDFNTPVALSVLFDLAHDIQRLREQGKSDSVVAACTTLKKLGAVFGILQKVPEDYFQGKESVVDIKKIETLIDERRQARKEKNWQRADEIREELMNLGIAIEDTADNTVWRRVD